MGSGLGHAGACDAIGITMAMFPDHRLVQVEGCRAVEALADGDEENVQRLGRAVSWLFILFLFYLLFRRFFFLLCVRFGQDVELKICICVTVG